MWCLEKQVRNMSLCYVFRLGQVAVLCLQMGVSFVVSSERIR